VDTQCLITNISDYGCRRYLIPYPVCKIDPDSDSDPDPDRKRGDSLVNTPPAERVASGSPPEEGINVRKAPLGPLNTTI
jgi:hypothetical protein